MRLTRNPLIQMRMRAGYSSAEKAALALGVSRTHLHNIERGRGSPSWDLMARMISLYGVTERQLRVEIRKAQRSLLKRKLAQT
jgi:DNA-binding XRE family transcriptional regulator